MGVFNVLETLFIFSLAIMFVLVGLLLYHIRGRLNAGEQRIDTLYELATNLSNEVNALKIYNANMRYSSQLPPPAAAAAPAAAPTKPYMEVHKIMVSDDEYDADEDDADSDSDDGAVSAEEDIEIITDDISESEQHEPILMDDVSTEIHVFKLNHEDLEMIAEEEDAISAEIIAEESPRVQELPDDDDAVAPAAVAVPEEESDYHKMTTGSLKKLVTERGLVTDASKMKKTDLIHILLAAV